MEKEDSNVMVVEAASDSSATGEWGGSSTAAPRGPVISPYFAVLVESATVWLKNRGGQGVLVPGGYILTAAHCVEWDTEGGMALGDYHFEPLRTASGASLVGSVCAVEPVADIAVLMAPDGQALRDESEAFEEWSEATAPVPLAERTLKRGDSVGVQVLTHKREWIAGTITRYDFASLPGATICLAAEHHIEAGTSGSPVVNDAGALVGLVSNYTEDDENHCGEIPVARLALPKWIVDKILDAQSRER